MRGVPVHPGSDSARPRAVRVRLVRLNRFLVDGGGSMVDTFRHFHPDEKNGRAPSRTENLVFGRVQGNGASHTRRDGGRVDGAAYTCWETITNARETNYGTRIDYVLASRGLVPGVAETPGEHRITDCHHLTLVRGSDHCPVVSDWEGKAHKDEPVERTSL